LPVADEAPLRIQDLYGEDIRTYLIGERRSVVPWEKLVTDSENRL
jgi:hypothetical protein